jgi:phosphoenolpyruvate-protein phosphotransferase
VVVAPDPATIARYRAREREIERARVSALAETGLPAVTKDGTTIELLANIGAPRESAAARAAGARGVGLFRTEFLFLERRTAPTEDEQTAAYGEVAAAFAPDPVTIRLLDAGGDKPIGYLPIAPEANPFLGVRALRLAEQRPDIFITQLRACYRAALRGRVKVMAPMVADAGDVDLFATLAAEARASLDRQGRDRGDVELGVMIEIPSAVLTADSYFPKVGFASLGTNDLLQYTLAADRGNAALTRYQDSLHPALLTLIRKAVDAADRYGTPLSVCGEMAADPTAALVLVGLGLRSLSLVHSALAGVKRAIRAVSLRDLEAAASAALLADSAGNVRRLFRDVAVGDP